MEKWKDVIGYEGFYKISDQGNIISCSRIEHVSGGALLFSRKRKSRRKAINLCADGYCRVILYKNGRGKMHYVHRLVSFAFIKSAAANREINHINGNKSDNRLENLEFVSRSENSRHAYRTGLINKTSCGKPHLSHDDIRAIRFFSTPKTNAILAKIYNRKHQIIYKIAHRKSWKDVP